MKCHPSVLSSGACAMLLPKQHQESGQTDCCSMGYIFNVLLSGAAAVETCTHIHSAELSFLAVYPQVQKKAKKSGKSQWQFVKEVLTFHAFHCSCPCTVKRTFLFCAHRTATVLKCTHRTGCCSIHFSQQWNLAQSEADFIKL